MPTPEIEPHPIERRISVRHLEKLGTVLVQQLGATGISGASIANHIEQAVVAECLRCGITLTGSDILAAAMAHEPGQETSEKQRRIHFGYCARKTCESDFYVVRFLPIPGLDWSAVWQQTEPLLTGAAPPAASAAGWSLGKQLIPWVRPWYDRARQPIPLTLIALAALWIGFHNGCRIPGISPTPAPHPPGGMDGGDGATPPPPEPRFRFGDCGESPETRNQANFDQSTPRMSPSRPNLMCMPKAAASVCGVWVCPAILT
jgi:hypothetical protein